ncbi:hypothetical protein AmaxDRAFT_3681 [Limnospira maxima CS-328]|uniref:Uncharacterized protein n=1 Tax=Limnospira maxima CS-328 TaxID=513049 RepID=B5W4I3_LIMMA|nr:hypothetical protein [Limnospira maxima]EDZ93583.1 hypothetical protein AmaxDRAFT_3681 [Limnospira maxima CS-328]
MSTLDTCKNCGKSVSSELTSCIHCEAVRCRICKQLDKCYSTSGMDDGALSISICSRCLQDIKSAKPKSTNFLSEWRCELCGYTNKESTSWRFKKYQPRCPYRPQRDLGYNNREYGFLTQKNVQRYYHSWNENSNNPNAHIKMFLGDYFSLYDSWLYDGLPNSLSCSNCGHAQKVDKLFYPAKLKDFECAYCRQYGSLESMSVLVRPCIKYESSYNYTTRRGDTLTCHICDEVRLIHNSCLKYCEKPTSNSVRIESNNYEIWSVEQVLSRADEIEKLVQNRIKKSQFVDRIPEFVKWLLLGLIIAAIYSWGWIGLLVSVIAISAFSFWFFH